MNKKTMRFTGIAVAGATFVAGIATMSVAATQANGSDGPLHIYVDANPDPTLVAPATSMAWDATLFGSSSSTDVAAVVSCPALSTGVTIFISNPGDERSPNAVVGGSAGYLAFAPGAFSESTKNVLLPTLTPSSLISGTPGQASLKSSGGTYSLGVACTSNSGATVLAAHYRSITVTPSTGAFTAAATTDAATATPTPTATADATLTGSIALSAETVAAVNGTLALSVPASAAATFGTPTLVNNKSTTTGSLPFVTVSDGRVVTKQGWTLSADVADFTSGVSPNVITIPKSALGIAPSISVGSTTAAGYFAGTATVAGNAAYPFTFAHAAANNTVGNTVVGGALTFVAPQDKAAGTYTSTLTLTLASK
jgi:hypothetical protein